jgi:ribonuclease R
MALTQDKILDAFRQSRDPHIKIKHLSRLLKLNVNQRRHLRETLDRMVREGILEKLRGGRFGLASSEPKKKQPHLKETASRKAPLEKGRLRNQVVGRLITHRDGYGFVEVEDARTDRQCASVESTARAASKVALPYRVPPSPTKGAVSSHIPKFVGDIFIPPLQMRGALNGDRVVVEIEAIKRNKRAEGYIVKVLERRFASVVGQFKQRGSTSAVLPVDDKFLHQVIIEPGADGGAKDGDIVDVEITRFPTPLESPRGRVSEILGQPGDFGIDVEIIIRKHHLPHRFPDEVKEAAQSVPPEVRLEEIDRREDFRALPIVTIDGETAKDFDDAVYVRRLPNGNYELQVHIADVAHYVVPHSSLDDEARLRGTAVYFPDRAVPMLPEELSNGICSLKPQVDRLVQSCIMEIDSKGTVVAHRFAPGVIRSVERMTYTSVAKILVDHDEATMKRYAPLVGEFRLMEELALVLNRMRDARGSIDFDLPEPVITFDENGLMTGIVRSERNVAHRLIEEFMLIANETVARELFQCEIPSLYRVHEQPSPEKAAEFEMMARSFGYSLGIDLVVKRLTVSKESRERHRRGQDMKSSIGTRGASGFEKPSLWVQPTEIEITPRHYQHLVEQLEGKPEERILSYLMLRSLKQARYSEHNYGHFGLASECYTHFTSPIRRYPDLIVHRILKSLIRSGKIETGTKFKHMRDVSAQPATYSKDQLAVLGAESSEAERRADDAERELTDWKKAKFMQQYVGEEFDGLIISVTRNGFYVELLEWFIEGFVPVASLIDDFYVYRENMQCLLGDRSKRKFRIGDRIRVFVDRVDEQSHKIQFLVSDIISGASSRRSRKRGKRF